MNEPATIATRTDVGELDPGQLAGIVQRASAPGFDRFRSQLRSSGYCARPVRLRGEICDQRGQRVWSTDGEPDGVLRKACGNRREAVCPSCAERYRQDAYHLIGAGMRGGKGVPDSVSAHPFVFATLTAPSFGHVHTRPNGKDGKLVGAARGVRRPSARTAFGSPAVRCTTRMTRASGSRCAWSASTTRPR